MSFTAIARSGEDGPPLLSRRMITLLILQPIRVVLPVRSIAFMIERQPKLAAAALEPQQPEGGLLGPRWLTRLHDIPMLRLRPNVGSIEIPQLRELAMLIKPRLRLQSAPTTTERPITGRNRLRLQPAATDTIGAT